MKTTRTKNRYHNLYERSLSGFALTKGGRQAIAYCPFHDDEGSAKKGFTANLEEGVYHCFSCGASGTAKQFAKKMGLPEYAPRVEYEKLSTLEDELREKIEQQSTMDYPESFTFLTGKEISIVGKASLKYLTDRGLMPEQIMRYKIGYCYKGKYKGRVVIPIADKDDTLQYFVARAITKGADEPYLNPAEGTETALGKTEVVFNLAGATNKDQVVVCEGVFDAIAVGQNGIAVLGKSASSIQLRYMKKMGAREFVVALDSDAHDDAMKLGQAMKKCGLDVRVATLPKGHDPASVNRAKLSQIIRDAEPVTFAGTVEAMLEKA